MKKILSILILMTALPIWANLLECSTSTYPKANISITENHQSKVIFQINAKEKMSCDIKLEDYTNLRKTQAPGDIAEFKLGACPPKMDKTLEARLRKEILLRIDFNNQKRVATLDWLADKQGEICKIKSFQSEALASFGAKKD